MVLYNAGVRYLPWYMYPYPNTFPPAELTNPAPDAEYYQYTEPSVPGYHYEGI